MKNPFYWLSVCLFIAACQDEGTGAPPDHVNALPREMAIYSVALDGSEELKEKYTFFFSGEKLDSIHKHLKINYGPSGFRDFSFVFGIDTLYDPDAYRYFPYEGGVPYANGNVSDVIQPENGRIKNLFFRSDYCEFQTYGFPMSKIYNTYDAAGRLVTIEKNNAAGACGDDICHSRFVYDDAHNRMFAFFDKNVDYCSDDPYADTVVYRNTFVYSHFPLFSLPFVNVGYDGRDCSPAQEIDTSLMAYNNDIIFDGFGTYRSPQYRMILPASEYTYPLIDKVYSGNYTLYYDYQFDTEANITQLTLTYKYQQTIGARVRYTFKY